MNSTDIQLIKLAQATGIIIGFFLGIVFASFWFCFIAGETIIKILY